MYPLSTIISPVRFSFFLLLLFALLLFQSPQPVQSIILSRLCGKYGHACFGGNWGKRALHSSPVYLSSDMDANDGETAISSAVDGNFMKNDVLKELRMDLFRQRLRHLLGLE